MLKYGVNQVSQHATMGLMHDFTILAGISSAPVDFFESIEYKILLISEPDTGWKENLGVFVGKFCYIFWILGCSSMLSMWQSLPLSVAKKELKMVQTSA